MECVGTRRDGIGQLLDTGNVSFALGVAVKSELRPEQLESNKINMRKNMNLSYKRNIFFMSNLYKSNSSLSIHSSKSVTTCKSIPNINKVLTNKWSP